MLLSIMERPVSEIIQENIKKFRDEAGLSQKELGLALGFPEENAQQRIYQYEKGKRSPGKDTLEQIAKILNKPYAAFVIENYQAAQPEDLDQAFAQLKKVFESKKQRSA